MSDLPIQHYYTPATAICYGCGPHNPLGLHIETLWDGKEGLCRFTPRPEHTAFPGVVYGGILASLIDCHSIGTAIAALYDHEGRPYGSAPEITCVTGNLNVSYLKPTPMGVELVLRASIAELGERKVKVACSIYADELETVRGELLAVRVRSRQGAEGL